MIQKTWVLLQNACQQVAQTCLANQLEDLTRQDLARAAAGTTPLYLVGRYGGGISGSTQARHLTCNCNLLHAIPDYRLLL